MCGEADVRAAPPTRTSTCAPAVPRPGRREKQPQLNQVCLFFSSSQASSVTSTVTASTYPCFHPLMKHCQCLSYARNGVHIGSVSVAMLAHSSRVGEESTKFPRRSRSAARRSERIAILNVDDSTPFSKSRRGTAPCRKLMACA